MVLTAAAAAAATGTGATGLSLFDYNRKNFLYDRKMRQETEYQIMEFKIQQADLWREDVKDIIGLTSVKMETYLTIVCIELSFCVMAFCEGRLAAGTPTWLVSSHMLSLGGAFMYLLMSVWFAMHACVTAKAYEVRLLTQHVRLPIPSWSELESARTYASGFEKVNTPQMLRVPFAMGCQESVLKRGQPTDSHAADSDDFDAADQSQEVPASLSHRAFTDDLTGATVGVVADLWGLELRGDGIYELDGRMRSDPRNLRHLKLVQQATEYWRSFDGFSRVAMSIGTNQLICALAYYVIAYVLISCHAVVACWLVVLLFMVIIAALIRLDMSLTNFEYRVCVFMVTVSPCMTAVAAQQWLLQTQSGDALVSVLAPLSEFLNACWLLFLLYVCKVTPQKGGAMLPTGFRSVMYIDIFGWIRTLRPPRRESTALAVTRAQTAMAQGATPSSCNTAHRTSVRGAKPNALPGEGPAVQALQYQKGRPVPMRPELVPGANPEPRHEFRRDEMDPTTFIPRMKDEEFAAEDAEDADEHFALSKHPGYLPWRIFSAGTVLLIALWWISGLLSALSLQGLTWFKVNPLLKMEELSPTIKAHKVSLLHQATELDGGVRISTAWPRRLVRPHSIACSAASGATITAASQFGLFTAHLGGGASGSRPRGLNFTVAPACAAVEGESLSDACFACRAGDGDDPRRGSDCQLVVLHRQGRLLSTCPVSSGSISAGGAQLGSTSVAEGWLGEADVASERAEEEVTSLALVGGPCVGSGIGAAGGAATVQRCAYAETSEQRIVEVRTELIGSGSPHAGHGKAAPAWYPTRVVGEAPPPAVADQEPSDSERRSPLLPYKVEVASFPKGRNVDRYGKLRLLDTPSGRAYLGTLRDAVEGQRGAQRLEVLDPRSGTLLSEVVLPRGRRWGSMCSTGDHLFLMEEGQSPQLWRFPMPVPLDAAAESSAAPAETKAELPLVDLHRSMANSRGARLAAAADAKAETPLVDLHRSVANSSGAGLAATAHAKASARLGEITPLLPHRALRGQRQHASLSVGSAAVH